MSKFEEYDLYARNKDFLISGNVITFTDVTGKLMALKPDVTLSIVRSGRDAAPGLRKLYYNENIYRPSAHGGPFRELTQAGVECQGEVDEDCVAEVLSLALRSLMAVSSDCCLTVSDLDVLSGLLERLAASGERRREILRCVADKNSHELSALCAGGDPAAGETLLTLITAPGEPEKALPLLRAAGFSESAERLGRLAAALDAGERLRVDFSIAGNLNYYNGVVFEGYVSGAPGRVLSGGQYDGLMRKLGRTDRAVGFAVYLDRLEGVFRGADS